MLRRRTMVRVHGQQFFYFFPFCNRKKKKEHNNLKKNENTAAVMLYSIYSRRGVLQDSSGERGDTPTRDIDSSSHIITTTTTATAAVHNQASPIYRHHAHKILATSGWPNHVFHEDALL